MASPGVLRIRLAAADLGADGPGACRDVTARVRRTAARLVQVDVGEDAGGASGGTGPATRGSDLRTIDALARLHLAVGRAGARLEVVGAGADLRALLALTGLADVLALAAPAPSGPRPPSDSEPPWGPGPPSSSEAPSGPGPPSGLEPQGQPEEAEVVLADEVRDAADPAVAHLEEVDGPRHAGAVGAGLVLGEPP